MQSNENTSFKYVMKSRDKQIEYCYSKSYVRLVVNHRSEGNGSIKFTYFYYLGILRRSWIVKSFLFDKARRKNNAQKVMYGIYFSLL